MTSIWPAVAGLRAVVDSTTCPPGPRTSWLGEAIVHGEDVRRPLGIKHGHPVEHVVQVAEFHRRSTALIGSRNRIKDLELRATDTDWSTGSGQLVEVRAIDLLLAMTGRGLACQRLSGSGVGTLRGRCS